MRRMEYQPPCESLSIENGATFVLVAPHLNIRLQPAYDVAHTQKTGQAQL
jgi:hypothetical protein